MSLFLSIIVILFESSILVVWWCGYADRRCFFQPTWVPRAFDSSPPGINVDDGHGDVDAHKTWLLVRHTTSHEARKGIQITSQWRQTKRHKDFQLYVSFAHLPMRRMGIPVRSNAVLRPSVTFQINAQCWRLHFPPSKCPNTIPKQLADVSSCSPAIEVDSHILCSMRRRLCLRPALLPDAEGPSSQSSRLSSCTRFTTSTS